MLGPASAECGYADVATAVSAIAHECVSAG